MVNRNILDDKGLFVGQDLSKLKYHHEYTGGDDFTRRNRAVQVELPDDLGITVPQGLAGDYREIREGRRNIAGK